MTEQNNPQPRIFKIGATTIVEDDSLTGKSLDEVKDILKRSYPEVAHATVRETTLENGSTCYHFISRPGRKG
jgi:PRTRC genetic system protein C